MREDEIKNQGGPTVAETTGANCKESDESKLHENDQCNDSNECMSKESTGPTAQTGGPSGAEPSGTPYQGNPQSNTGPTAVYWQTQRPNIYDPGLAYGQQGPVQTPQFSNQGFTPDQTYQMYNPGPYAHPPYGPQIPCLPSWAYQGPANQPGYSPFHPAMVWPQTHQPYFAATPGVPYGSDARPRHHVGSGAKQSAEFNDVIGKAMQGQASPQDLIGGLLSLNFGDDQFWKGILVGSVAALIFNSEAVREALLTPLMGLFGSFQEEAQTKY